jgi:hypothetical protein
MEPSREIFSFHLMKLPLRQVPFFLFSSTSEVSGLKHSEKFLTMNLGASIATSSRYNFKTAAFFAWWEGEHSLDEFLKLPDAGPFSSGWHVRMKLYRRWGQVSELKDAVVTPELANQDKPVVAVTLARLNLFQTTRFIKWGKPVEKQVRDHHGQTMALAAIRPLNTFSTFSIWKNESEMINMVHGRKQQDGDSHKLAMQERERKDFHREFTTMRFAPFKEIGEWNRKSGYLSLEEKGV